MPVLRRPDGRVLCVGHRGAPLRAAENTLASFRAAVACGVDLVEIDILALGDGTLVVAHSDDLAEITHGRRQGVVGDQTLERLRALAPDLPTLDDALALFSEEASDVGLHLDLKSGEAAARVGAAIAERGLLGRTVLSSTDRAVLVAAAAATPGLTVGLTYPHDRHGISRRPFLAPVVGAGLRLVRAAAPVRVPRLVGASGASAAFLHHDVVTARTVRRLHAAGVAVLAWTVDEPALVRRLVDAGVDGVISNDVEMLLATLRP